MSPRAESGGIRRVCWVDGEIVPLETPVARGDDSAFSLGLGCYTSARVENGAIRHEARHIHRLERGARELRLGRFDGATARRAFAELADAAFPGGLGIIRLQLSRDSDGALHVVGVPREVGPEPAEWRAILAHLPHDGAELSGGLKVTSRLTLALVAEHTREQGADEALLLDGSSRLVEAAGSNIFVVDGDGALLTPPLARGAVSGIAREIILERVAEVAERDVTRDALFAARELIATNAVRGARAITVLEGRTVGDGRTGPVAHRLDEVLATD